jgi:hypothetical protein
VCATLWRHLAALYRSLLTAISIICF